MFPNICKLLLLASAVTTSSATPLQRRGTIGVNDVQPFAQAVQPGQIGANMLRYKPWLNIESGCVPYPAVDASGNTNGGLKPSGDPRGGCSSSTGQVYSRAGQYNGRWGIMYAWYMPKDSPSTGIGHRHDWENVVVWVDDANSASPNFINMAASGHGQYESETSNFDLDGARPKIRYFNTWPTDHQLGFTTTRGGEQPLIAWESLTDAARNALTNTDFGDAGVPFKDSSFNGNLAKAWA